MQQLYFPAVHALLCWFLNHITNRPASSSRQLHGRPSSFIDSFLAPQAAVNPGKTQHGPLSGSHVHAKRVTAQPAETLRIVPFPPNTPETCLQACSVRRRRNAMSDGAAARVHGTATHCRRHHNEVSGAQQRCRWHRGILRWHRSTVSTAPQRPHKKRRERSLPATEPRGRLHIRAGPYLGMYSTCPSCSSWLPNPL